MQPKEDYVLKLLEDAGLITRAQIEQARSKLNGTANVVDLLVEEGVVSEADVSRSLAAQAHMDWIDLAAKVIPPEVIEQISAEDARRFKVIPVGLGERVDPQRVFKTSHENGKSKRIETRDQKTEN